MEDDRSYRICYSSLPNASEAFRDVISQMKDTSPVLILFFSDINNFTIYTEKFHELYPDTEIIGSTTYVSLSSKGHDKTALSVLSVTDGIECTGGVITEVTRYPAKQEKVIRDCVSRFVTTENCCAFEITNAFCSSEEIVQDTFRFALEKLNIPVFGGSAGNAGNSTNSFVSYNGSIYTEACVFVLIHNLHGAIKIFRENLFQPTNKFFDVTDVDCEERTVYEFDGKPAANVIAKALGVTVDKLPSLLSSHPLGRMTDGEIYITEHNQVKEDGSLSYFARIYNHTKVALLVPDDPKKVLSSTIDTIKAEVKDFRFMIVVNCLSRSKLFEENMLMNYFTERLKDELGEYIGFSGYGEQTDYEHLNQTMLIAVFE